MRSGRSVDNAGGRCGGFESLTQTRRNNKIRHVIKCESIFEPIFAHLACTEQCASIID